MVSSTRVLAETCGDMLADVDKLVAEVATTSPGHRALDEALRLAGGASMEISLTASISVFLGLARDLRPSVETDYEWDMRATALGWARSALDAGVLDLPGLLKLSTSAHVLIMRKLLAAVPNDHVVSLLGPLGAWHDGFFSEAHGRAAEALRTTPPLHGRQRTGDQHRNWLLHIITSPDGELEADEADQMPARIYALVIRAGAPVIGEMLDGEERPDSWWTVWRPTAEQLVVVGDLDRDSGDWITTTMLALHPDSSALGVVAADSGRRVELPRILSALRSKVADYRPAPLRPGEVLSGNRLELLDSIVTAPAASDRFVGMLARIADSGELTHSVHTLLSCDLNLSRASELLAVHRSTLVYRLDRVVRMTGVDPRTTEGAALWWIALGIGRRSG
ncbi:PucR C-terminal helix-turn-helix domain-containing protein [Lentzea albida]|uniref:PucR C-terminal helix-turn-helix domain-containing protein n=2 Tax=Lentzea albida TaxID=65499 RepID=A0A1H9X5P8_9PSEU|nr:PucR C-terminal helix-turn-helix domain-containing protein [Lentzea albida]